MHKHLIFFIVLILCLAAKAQTPDSIKTFKIKKETPSEIYTSVEEFAEFPGGTNGLFAFVRANLHYPLEAREKGISGKVFLKFVIDEFGIPGNIEILKGLPGCPACDAEAISMAEKMPVWRPAKVNGKPVKCYYNLPLSFKVN